MEAAFFTIIIIALLHIIAAFFSASETSVTAASDARIHRLKSEGNRKAIILSGLREKKERFIGAILLGSNVANIVVSAIASSFAITRYGEEGVVVATIILTFTTLLFGEVIPKTYAVRHPEQVALLFAPILSWVVRIFAPITMAVQSLVNILLPVKKQGADILAEEAVEELRGTIELHHNEGAVIKRDKNMLGGILDLMDLEVGEIMTHRRNVESVSISEKPSRLIKKVLGSRHTRIPVWKDKPENIIGILHAKDLLRALQEHAGDIESLPIANILMKPWFVPETTTLMDQLHAFRAKRQHFAMVVDEYGSLLGIVTLEDIIEEVVGSIQDEHDRNPVHIARLDDGAYSVDGTMSVRDLNRELDFDLPEEYASTIAGLIIHQSGVIPNVGQVFSFFGYRFEIKEKQRNQLTKIILRKMEDEGKDKGGNI